MPLDDSPTNDDNRHRMDNGVGCVGVGNCQLRGYVSWPETARRTSGHHLMCRQSGQIHGCIARLVSHDCAVISDYLALSYIKILSLSTLFLAKSISPLSVTRSTLRFSLSSISSIIPLSLNNPTWADLSTLINMSTSLSFVSYATKSILNDINYNNFCCFGISVIHLA